MLGHDMRNPLFTVVAAARYLSEFRAGDEISVAAARLMRSGVAIRALLDDLTDFNRTHLGLGIKIAPSRIDLAAVLGDELEQFRGLYPQRRIELEVHGDCCGWWDGQRLQQSLRNLLGNAIAYGEPEAPIRVALRGDATAMRLQVMNRGTPLDSCAMNEIFDPLKRGVDRNDSSNRGSLGLGLFIVREIARAHGGEVEVQSDNGMTVFTMRLPRGGAPEQAPSK